MLDREALLAALVLSPATFSRNRFFDMYQDPDVRRVRRRAARLRNVVRHVAGAGAEEMRFSPAAEGLVELAYTVPSVGLRRAVLLDPLELALVRVAIARSRGVVPAGDPDMALVKVALAKLTPASLLEDVKADG